MKTFIAATAVLLLISSSVNARFYNNRNCDIFPPAPLTNPYGPYDYTNPDHQIALPIVIGAHFTQTIQRLSPGIDHSADIAYTLRAIPNYHPALYAASQYQQQKKLSNKKSYTAECFFKRAIYFSPKDATARMLFAMHLQATKRFELAEQYYESALTITPHAAELNYNYGLFMFDRGNLEKAKEAAKIAYRLGYPLPGLKRKLASVNGNN